MCDPLTLGAAALSTAGAIGTAQTNADYVSAVNRANKDAYNISRNAREAETQRQDDYQTEANTAFDQLHGKSTREEFDNSRTASATDFLDQLNTRPDALNVPFLAEDASVDVQKDAAVRTNKAAAESRDRIRALADLTSYGSTQQGRARNYADTSDFLSTLGGLRRGSLGVASQEQDIAPATVTPGNNTFADLLSGGGMFLGMAGPTLFGSPAAVPGGMTTSLRPQLRPT